MVDDIVGLLYQFSLHSPRRERSLEFPIPKTLGRWDYCCLALNSGCYADATRDDPQIKVFHLAVTSSHLYTDDLGITLRPEVERLKILKGLPGSGAGYIGGSWVVPSRQENAIPQAYEELAEMVTPITLDDLVFAVLKLTGADEIDFLKMDCEGCEHSALGLASQETLNNYFVDHPTTSEADIAYPAIFRGETFLCQDTTPNVGKGQPHIINVYDGVQWGFRVDKVG